MCICRLSLSYLSSESMQIWNLRFPAFVASYKRAELQRLRRPETRVKLHFFVNSRLLLLKKSSQLEMYLILPNFLNLMYVRSVTWCACFPWICIVCAFVTFHEFTTVRCYGRDGTKKRGTMNCVRFRSTCPNNWRIFRCLWNTWILGLWNFIQLKCLVFHAWEMCFKLKSHF